jgi:very-short-patch-repair endonuclease
MTDRGLTRAANDAIRAKILRPEQIGDVIERNPTHPGAPRLGPFLEIERPTRSPLEDDFLELCRRYALPRPRVNRRRGRYELDAYFEAEQLIVEVDGYGFHNDRDAFERDRLRDADALEADGTPTLRNTEDRMRTQPAREAERLHTILARRRAELSRGSGPTAGSPPA